MNKQTATTIFKSLRAIQILIIFICFVLETVEYAAFQSFHADQGFDSSDYFNAQINPSSIEDSNVLYYNGTKVFFYIVLVLTLIDGGFYLSRQCRYHNYVGPYKRDISINAFFMTLWLISGITNIYPIFQGYEYTCVNLPIAGNPDAVVTDAIARECNAKVMVISFGWINGVLFLISTFIALKLWRGRQERYDGERRVEALGEVVYKYKPRPNTIVRVDEPEQVMIYKTFSKHEKKRGTPTYTIRTSHTPI